MTARPTNGRQQSTAPSDDPARPPSGPGPLADTHATARPFILMAVLWTALVAALGVRDNRRAHEQAFNLARTEAISSFEKDLLYRRWASRHGGVYVQIDSDTPPNPYLAHVPERDISTPSGRKLTLMNPAYMTRQVHELGNKLDGSSGHITSLRPLRPENTPDAWEARALRAFEQRGDTMMVSLETVADTQFLRFMKPLKVEPDCLKCHAKQGYQVGDIRGGLSVSVKFRDYDQATLARSADLLQAYAGIWLLGLGGLGFAYRRIRQAAAQRAQAETARARLERELLQTQKMELVGRLAGGVAHDFNNMLMVIRGFTEVALEQADPSTPVHDDLRQILEATERSADLTRQLLAFARKQTISPRVLDLNEAVVGLLKMLGRLIGEDVRLQWHPGTGLWPVNADPSQLDQILVNLCLNARDAITNVGTLTIATGNSTLDAAFAAARPGCRPGDYVRLSVTDNGAGMDAETRDHLFEPFFTTKARGKGTGLGLSTVYGIVKQNDGFVDVDSAPGRGTTLTVYLPRYQGDANAEPVSTGGSAAPRGHETVLLVEDEPAILRTARGMLEHQGYQVLATTSPTEAIRLARESEASIDLVVTDVIMPEMNGRDLVDVVRSHRPTVACLYMSGYTADVIGHHGVLDPGMHFIQKPFSRHDLAVKVRRALDRA